MALDEAYRSKLEVIREKYKATMRDRGGKVYLTLYWENGTFRTYEDARDFVKRVFPDSYMTSASTCSDATFRVNPPGDHWSQR